MTVTDETKLREILMNAHNVATVGVSSSEEKPSFGIFAYLKAHGYNMIPVNPTAATIQGIHVYPDLAAVPGKVDVVQVFRKPEDVPPVVEQAIRIGAKVVWMQEGIVNDAAAQRAEAAGLQVVMDRCMMKTHMKLIGDKTAR